MPRTASKTAKKTVRPPRGGEYEIQMLIFVHKDHVLTRYRHYSSLAWQSISGLSGDRDGLHILRKQQQQCDEWFRQLSDSGTFDDSAAEALARCQSQWEQLQARTVRQRHDDTDFRSHFIFMDYALTMLRQHLYVKEMLDPITDSTEPTYLDHSEDLYPSYEINRAWFAYVFYLMNCYFHRRLAGTDKPKRKRDPPSADGERDFRDLVEILREIRYTDFVSNYAFY